MGAQGYQKYITLQLCPDPPPNYTTAQILCPDMVGSKGLLIRQSFPAITLVDGELLIRLSVCVHFILPEDRQ